MTHYQNRQNLHISALGICFKILGDKFLVSNTKLYLEEISNSNMVSKLISRMTVSFF